jgi:uncharacterized protein YegP (UPF0339 family)
MAAKVLIKPESTLVDIKQALESLGFHVRFSIEPAETKGGHMTKRTARFHIRRTRSGEYRPYLKAANGEQVGGSETYKTIASATKWITRLDSWVVSALGQEIVMDKRS